MGRNAIHKPESLKVGEKMELTGKAKKYSWQYVYNFNKRGRGEFQHIREEKRIFIQRTK